LHAKSTHLAFLLLCEGALYHNITIALAEHIQLCQTYTISNAIARKKHTPCLSPAV